MTSVEQEIRMRGVDRCMRDLSDMEHGVCDIPADVYVTYSARYSKATALAAALLGWLERERG